MLAWPLPSAAARRSGGPARPRRFLSCRPRCVAAEEPATAGATCRRLERLSSVVLGAQLKEFVKTTEAGAAVDERTRTAIDIIVEELETRFAENGVSFSTVVIFMISYLLRNIWDSRKKYYK